MSVVINGTAGITAPGTETFGDGTALGGATNPIVSMAKGDNNYVQGYIVNNTNGVNSSADLVCYPSNGTDSSGWIDMGITGPTFSQAAYGITGANEGYIFMSAPSGASKTGNLVIATDSTGTQNAIKFATGGFGSTTERMRLDASGNLGVGTTSPAHQLDVSNGARAKYLQVTNNGYSGSAATTPELYSPASGTLAFACNGGERARIDSSGNLLVGTTNTSSTAGNGLKVTSGSGAADSVSVVTGATTNAGLTTYQLYSTGVGAYRFYVGGGGTVFATITTISAISDIRFKENVRDLDAGLAEVMALKPRLYDWKEGKGADIKNARGFIAQEFEQVFPDLIDEWRDPAPEGEEPYKSVRQDLMPVLVKAIQEQQAIIEQLQADVAALKGNA